MPPSARTLGSIALLALLGACGGSAPATPPVPAPQPAPAPPPAAEPRSWSVRRAAGSWAYELTTEATVELQADSARAQAPVRTTARITLRVQPGAGAADGALDVAGTLEAFEVTRGGAIPVPDSTTPAPDASAPTAYRARYGSDGRLLELKAPAPTACSPADQAASAVRELVVPTPPSLEVGTRWSDTTSLTFCRAGGIPVTTGAVRDYLVERTDRVNGALILRLHRTEIYTLAGSGVAQRQSLSVAGRGGSTATLELDPATGLLVRGTSEGESTLTVTAGRTPPAMFRQKVKTEIRRR